MTELKMSNQITLSEKIGYMFVAIFLLVFAMMAIATLTGQWIPGESELAGFEKLCETSGGIPGAYYGIPAASMR